MDILREPRITLIARPSSSSPPTCRSSGRATSSDGERIAEFAGRLCYMSQHNPAGRTTAEYLQNILRQGHGSVFEHATYVMLIEGISRSCSHELVRHRAGWGYSQLSQRYVDESHAAFVMPPAILGDDRLEAEWTAQVEAAQAAYVAAVEHLMTRYAWVRRQGPPAEDGPRGGAERAAQRDRGEDRGQRERPRLAHDARAPPRRGSRARDPPDGGGLPPRAPAEAPALFGDFEIYSATDGSEAGRVGFHKV